MPAHRLLCDFHELEKSAKLHGAIISSIFNASSLGVSNEYNKTTGITSAEINLLTKLQNITATKNKCFYTICHCQQAIHVDLAAVNKLSMSACSNALAMSTGVWPSTVAEGSAPAFSSRPTTAWCPAHR